MKSLTLCALALILSPMAASAERTFTFTGQNGGTTEGVVDCAKVDNTITCDRTATATTGAGKVFDRTAERLITRDGNEITIKTTGENGRTITTTRIFDR
jgi:hypothetical protein